MYGFLVTETHDTAIGFRWRLEAIPAQQADIIRLKSDGDVSIILLSNGFQTGFSRCWPVGSNLLLDAVVEAWETSSATPRDRLATVFDQAVANFTCGADKLGPPDVDFPESEPAATLLVLVVHERKAHVMWIGGDSVHLLRRGGIVESTTPHTGYGLQLEQSRSRAVAPSPHANRLTRTISRSADSNQPESKTLDLQSGDVIVVVSHGDHGKREWSFGEMIPAVCAQGSTTEMAGVLADQIAETGELAFAVTGLIRIP